MKQTLLIFLLFYCTVNIAQRTITGNVSDVDGPLYGATVWVKGTDNGTVTDFDGNFSIVANDGDILVFSNVSYNKKEVIVIESKNIIEVILENDPNEVIIILRHPYSTNRINNIYGVNYQTIGLELDNYEGLLPFQFSFGLRYVTDFNRNTEFQYNLYHSVIFSNDFHLNFKASAEGRDFNNFQFHSYKLETSKSLDFSQPNSKYHRNLFLNLIVGVLNFDGTTSENEFGYGVGLSREIFNNFYLQTSFINWKQFNEFNTKAFYKWNWSKWNITASYKHLSNYKEFQIGIGYRIDLYNKLNTKTL